MNIKKIRDYICLLRGKKVTIVYRGSRNKKERYDGIVYKTYMNVFSIILENGDIRCFSYIDLLINTIKVFK